MFLFNCQYQIFSVQSNHSDITHLAYDNKTNQNTRKEKNR